MPVNANSSFKSIRVWFEHSVMAVDFRGCVPRCVTVGLFEWVRLDVFLIFFFFVCILRFLIVDKFFILSFHCAVK